MNSKSNATMNELLEMKGKYTDFLQRQNLLSSEVVKNHFHVFNEALYVFL